MNISHYYEIKSQMKTGDLLLWHSTSVIGGLIRTFSKGEYNHASMVMCFKDYEGEKKRRWTTEANEKGTILNLLSRRLEAFNGYVDWFPLKDEWNDKREIIGANALELIGIPYDYKSLFRNILGRVSTEARELFCSEYYFLSLGLEGKSPTPNDLCRLNFFKEKIRI
jgi:hypothetical protein